MASCSNGYGILLKQIWHLAQIDGNNNHNDDYMASCSNVYGILAQIDGNNNHNDDYRNNK